jgi:periplasmic copper chaperone A
MTKNWIAAIALLIASLGAHAQTAPVKVEGAWVRASVQGQSGTGAFMVLNAAEPLQLVGVSTPVAGVAEVHEMKMEGDVMRMRAVGTLALAPGKPLALKPGGYHVMLMDLKKPLKPGTQVPMTLQFRNAKGEASRIELSVPVAVQAGNNAHKH